MQHRLARVTGVVEAHSELVAKAGGTPGQPTDFPQLEPDYAYLLEHVGDLDFRQVEVVLEIPGFDYPQLDYPSEPELPELASCCYCIATSYSGDDLLQICAGRYKGALMAIDHEVLNWDEVEESELYQAFKNAGESERGACFDALVEEWLEESVSLMDSLAEAIDAAFSSHTPAHANFIAIRSNAKRVSEHFVRPLVNSVESRLKEKDPEADAALNAVLGSDLELEDAAALFEKIANTRSPSDFPFFAMRHDEAVALVCTYETYIEPRISLLCVSPEIYAFIDRSYSLRAICYVIDAYLIAGRQADIEASVDAWRTLVASLQKSERSGSSHVLSLRLAAVLAKLGRHEEAMDALESTNFAGFSRDRDEFRAYVESHGVFEALRGIESERVAAFLTREEPAYVGAGGVWGYHGSHTIDDLLDMPMFVEQRIGMPPEGTSPALARSKDQRARAEPGRAEVFFAPLPTELHPGFREQALLKKHGILAGITVHGSSIYLMGGLGTNLALVSHDGGDTFQRMPLCQEVNGELVPIVDLDGQVTGLRYAFVDGETVYVAAQFGKLLRSTNGGKSFIVHQIGTTVLQTVFRADGRLWATGDGGAHQSIDGGESWTRVEVEGEIVRCQGNKEEAVLPSSEGYLYLSRGGEIRKTALRAPVEIWAGCRSPQGTLLAVGAKGAIYRSTDDGALFEQVDSGVSASMQNIACLEGGVVVVVGADTILRSSDDGASFQRIPQDHIKGWIFGAAAFGDQVLVAGADGVVLTVG
ncbi:MAG: WD40/YVTN/BNR-like repeat-containing protein [Polyangiales bacterium]